MIQIDSVERYKIGYNIKSLLQKLLSEADL